MRTGFPCNENRFFPVGIDLQSFPVSYTGFGFAVCLHAIAKVKQQVETKTQRNCGSGMQS